MAVRTVRMDTEDEKRLERVRRKTGWTSSAALKEGVRLLDRTLADAPTADAFEIYASLDLGPGGYAAGPAAQSRETARRVIARKHKR